MMANSGLMAILQQQGINQQGVLFFSLTSCSLQDRTSGRKSSPCGSSRRLKAGGTLFLGNPVIEDVYASIINSVTNLGFVPLEVKSANGCSKRYYHCIYHDEFDVKLFVYRGPSLSHKV